MFFVQRNKIGLGYILGRWGGGIYTSGVYKVRKFQAGGASGGGANTLQGGEQIY